MRSTGGADELSISQLNRLQSRMDRWRGRHKSRKRLPEMFWKAAAALARRLGASHVSRNLRLNYYKLNRWMAQGDDPEMAATKAAFVEVALSDPGDFDQAHGYRAEMVDATPERLILHLGQDRNAVVALAESFWRRQR